MISPAEIAGRLCGSSPEEERDRVRAILRTGERLGVPEVAKALAYETRVSIGQAQRVLAMVGNADRNGGRHNDNER